ncbi:MAG TPA: hypothetical protein VJS18_21170, partial [Paraburkholderia sp.]|nr:hypothetical protein [Paraburkholderia sp.]
HQAAVDAAVSQVVRDERAQKAMATTPPAPAPAPAPIITPPPAPAPKETTIPDVQPRTPSEAASALLGFLIKTGRFGIPTDRPKEVYDAQRDLGVKPDGIVGPLTRAAAKKVGVALPPRPAKYPKV